MSVEVKAQNSISMTSIKAIKDATDQSAQLLSEMEDYAQQAGTTLTGIYQDAEDAKTNAQNASEYASRALGNLSTVQSVAETLNWITQHGTMTLTTDTALDPSHVYFVADQNGDYVVGGVHYSVVSEPDTANISTYYELSIDESLNNYVGTHLAVDSEGLWLIPGTNGNKVLIATGSGNTYTTAGTYIIGKDNGTDVILAQFLSTGAVIGQTDNVHVEIDEDSFLMIDGSGTEFAHIGSPKEAQITDTFVYSESNRFLLSDIAILETIVVKINDTETTNWTASQLTVTNVTVNDTLVEGDEVAITYTTATEIKYYTLGVRDGNTGRYSLSEGRQTTASGVCSHAEGSRTKATGDYSHAEGAWSKTIGRVAHAEGYQTEARGTTAHAEGYEAKASGEYAHAGGYRTIAGFTCQTAIGRYNSNRTDTLFEIGNGKTGRDPRSNAFAVTWDGNAELDLAGYQTAGNIDKTIYDALVALGWDSEVTA